MNRKDQHLRACKKFRTDDRSSLFPSETVPDEAMTIPYIMARYVKGLSLPVQKTAVDYQTENHDSPDYEKMLHADLIEMQEFKEQVEEIEAAHKEQVKTKKEKAQQKQQQQQQQQQQLNQKLSHREEVEGGTPESKPPPSSSTDAALRH